MKSGIHSVILAATLVYSASAFAATVTLTTSKSNPAIGEPFTVTVNLSSAAPFANWAQFLKFDKTRLKVTAQAAGSFSTFIQDGRSLADINASGEVRAGGFALSNNAGGSGTLGVFTFEPLANGTTNITTENKSPSSPFGNVLQPAAGSEVLPTIAGPLAINVGAVTNFTLTINTAGSGSGSVGLNPPGGTYASGSIVTLTASAGAGSTFAGWSGSLSGSTNPTTITMDANKSVTATFNTIPPPPTFTLSISMSGTGTGSVTLNPPGGTYTSGTVVTMTAVPGANSAFDGWSGNMTGSVNPATITMTSNKSVIASMKSTLAANKPPVISSLLTYSPGLPVAGEVVSFVIAASDPEGQPLTVTYSYGDGTVDTTARHIYVAGIYEVTASVSDGVNTVSATAPIIIVSTGGPGTPPAGASGKPGGTGQPMSVSKKSIKAKNPSSGADSLQFTANLVLPDSTKDLNASIIVIAGSAAPYQVTLSNGKAKTGKSSFAIKAKTKKGVLLSPNVSFTAKCGDRDFLAVLEDAGLDAGTSGSATVGVSVVINDTLYTADLVFSVKGTAKGASGK